MNVWDILTPEVLIIVAGGAFVLSYLIIQQVVLRLVMLLGSVVYVAYYATAAPEPLWGAIWTSLLMILTNLIGLFGLYARSAAWSIPGEHRDIARHFAHLAPGDLRLILRSGTRETLRAPRVITREGVRPQALTFVISGHLEVTKQGQHFFLPPGLFAGEVAYLLGQPSAATTTVPLGAEIISWPLDVLEKRSRRSPRFKLAMEAAMSKDLATKVAGAVALKEWEGDQVVKTAS